MKKSKRKQIISVLLCVGTLFLSATVVSLANDNSTDTTSVLEARNCLNTYIKKNYPKIKIDSQEYIEFLSEQLILDKDESLLKQEKYQEMMAYASLYVINPDDFINSENRNENGKRKVWSAYSAIEKQENAEIDEVEDSSASSTGLSTSKSISYARKYALNPNTPAYPSLSSDCTNFVSQCIKAGGKKFTYAPSYKTKPERYETTKYCYSYHYTSTNPYHRYKQSTSFIRVSDFYTYWKNKGATVISCKNRSTLQDKAKLGDVVQLSKKNSSGKMAYYHTIIITGGKKGDWKYSGRTNNVKDASVSKIASTNSFRIIRIK